MSLFSFFGGAFGGIMWCLHGTIIPLYYYWVHTHLIHATLQLLVQLWFLRMDPYSVWLAAMRGKGFGALGGASSTSNTAMTSVTPGSDKA